MAKNLKKIKIIIPVKKNKDKEDRMALNAVLGPLGIKIKDVLNKFDDIIKFKTTNWEDKTPFIVQLHVKTNPKTQGKAESYEMFITSPSLSFLIKKELGIEKCSKLPGKEICKFVDHNFVEKIYNLKFCDSNDMNKESCIKSIIGTLKSMGIIVK